jgi:hypothetical protein
MWCGCAQASLRVVRDLADIVGFLNMYITLWIDDIVLSICLIVFLAGKHHPRFCLLDWWRLHLWRSDELSLAFGLAMVLSIFLVLQKIHVSALYTAIDCNTPHLGKGDYRPRPHWMLAPELGGAGSPFVLK